MSGNKRSVQEVLNAFGARMVEALQKSLPSGTASGLRDSIHFQLELDGEKYAFRLFLADYYYWMDKGRAAGKAPPIQPDVIRSWIQDKGLQLEYKGLKKGSASKTMNRVTAQKSLAFLIGRKIARKGTRGNNFYSSVMTEDVLPQLQQELGAAFKTDVSMQLKTTLNELSR